MATSRTLVWTLAAAAALACVASVQAANLRQPWLAFLEGPASAGGNQCCHSAACESDHHCVAATCSAGGQNASVCSDYSCSHCECCPCCGAGHYCYSSSSTPFTKGVCCPIGYSGSDCKTPICAGSCGHGTCSAPDTCTCDKGWGGAACDTPVCEPACAHGKCFAPDTCTCEQGWSGATCADPVCPGGCHHGNCTAPGVCTCQPVWSGTDCNTPLCPAGCVHGVCQSPSNCVCGAGWEGASCDTCIPDPYKWMSPAGDAFKIQDVQLLGCTWKAGTQATVVATGTTSKQITAGSVAWRLYEIGAQHFVASGDSNYFQCSNKGCDPSRPIALRLQDPTANATNFTLTFSFNMTAQQTGAANSFSLYSYGEDQDHFPYDFDLTIDYNYTQAPPAATSFVDLLSSFVH